MAQESPVSFDKYTKPIIEPFKKFKLKSYIIWKYSGSFDSTTESEKKLDRETCARCNDDDQVELEIEKEVDEK